MRIFNKRARKDADRRAMNIMFLVMNPDNKLARERVLNEVTRDKLVDPRLKSSARDLTIHVRPYASHEQTTTAQQR